MAGFSSSTFVRELTAGDIPAAQELSAAAGWNQTADDWRMLLQLDPEGCAGLECDGRLVATTTLICYGETLAWIGMVLTHRDYQRRGFARRLVQSAIARADLRRVATVKLDATDQGRALYQSLGFREEQEIQRWSRTSPSQGQAARLDPGVWPAAAAQLDREAFGADRRQVLQFLAQREQPLWSGEGYLFRRPGSRAGYLGPYVARTPGTARELLAAALAGRGPRWYWDLFPSHREAVALATELGFRMDRSLTRMVRGADLRGNDTLIYGTAGFEVG